jgi:dienelactone hydrolase
MRLAVLTIALLLSVTAQTAGAAECTNMGALKVPGAEKQENACLDDLTTAGTSQNGHTDASDWETLHAQGTVNPSGVPGIQVDGYFPDTSTTNGTHGWNHDSQFVMRFPDKWNGTLVISGAPGVRKQYSPDYIISDWVLARGYAYASTDKGNNGTSFQNDGQAPGDAIAEWHTRVTELTLAMKAVLQQRYGRAPSRSYITGISNGGYLTRWQLENHPELFDGGVDWEGTLFRPEGPNLFTYLPVALAHYRQWRASGSQADHDAMIAAGFEPGSEVVWDHHYGVYWDLTQRTYREELDPEYDGSLNGGAAFCAPGTPMCDANYDYFSRPPEVRNAVNRVSLSGRIGKPLLTLHGTLDALLPIRTDSDVYARLVQAAGRGVRGRRRAGRGPPRAGRRCWRGRRWRAGPRSGSAAAACRW